MADPEAENLCQLWLVLHNLEVGLPEIYLVYNKFGENYWNLGLSSKSTVFFVPLKASYSFVSKIVQPQKVRII